MTSLWSSPSILQSNYHDQSLLVSNEKYSLLVAKIEVIFQLSFIEKHIVFQPNVWKVYKNSPLNLVKSVGFEGKIKLIKDKEKKSTRTITISLRTSFRSIIYLINLSTSTKFVVKRLCKALSLVLQSQLHIKKYVDLK